MDQGDVAKSPDELATSLDVSADILELQRLLDRSLAWAEAQGNLVLQRAIQVEDIAVRLFWSANNASASIADPSSTFTGADIEYLEHRRTSSEHLRLRALYAHAVAWATRRFDAGETAVQHYIEAIDSCTLLRDRVQSERWLRSLAPLAMSVAATYRKLDDIAGTLINAARNSRPVLRLTIIELLIPRLAFTADQYVELCSMLRQIISDLAETSLLDQLLLAGRLGVRLDDRNGTPQPKAWDEDLLRALEKVARTGEHPVLRERAAQHAALALQRLGRHEERAKMISLQREIAEDALPKQSLSFSIDEDGSFASSLRLNLDAVLEKNGELGVLAWIGLSYAIMPRLSDARDAIAKQRRAGIGVFRQIAATVARSRDNRVVGHSHAGSENDVRALWEQYGFACVYASYAVDVFARHLIANGRINEENFASLLRQTWLSTSELPRSNELIELLMAPVKLYFSVMRRELQEEAIIPAIDSLTMRFEEVFRKLARLRGLPDVIERQDSEGRVTTGVRGLGILKEPALQNFLGEDLSALASHTLSGLDEGLRDSVGHATMGISDYTTFTAHSLVFLLLRLALTQPEPE